MKRRILEGETDPNTFVVIDLEASLGKSVETNRILKEYIESYQFTGQNHGKPYRKFLLVKRFAKDVEDSAQYIGENVDKLYQGFGNSSVRITDKGQHVIGITSDNWSYYRQNLEVVRDSDVLIITHSRYKMLCEDDELRRWFTEEGTHRLLMNVSTLILSVSVGRSITIYFLFYRILFILCCMMQSVVCLIRLMNVNE
ncbi:hypothetical protein D3C74_72580 [compost metagenome]